MTIELNHIIVFVKDPRASAKLLASILGVKVEREWGHFVPVKTQNGVTLDFAEDDDIRPQHCAFLVSEAEFDAALARLKKSGAAVTLRFSERSLADCRPLSLLGNASVRALGTELGLALDRRRFRANLYADWQGGDLPYRENDLVGRTLAIGERVRLAILERDPRCKMITIDPTTAQTDRRILRHVNEAHGTTMGVYAAVLVEGVVRRGDGIRLV